MHRSIWDPSPTHQPNPPPEIRRTSWVVQPQLFTHRYLTYSPGRCTCIDEAIPPATFQRPGLPVDECPGATFTDPSRMHNPGEVPSWVSTTSDLSLGSEWLAPELACVLDHARGGHGFFLHTERQQGSHGQECKEWKE